MSTAPAGKAGLFIGCCRKCKLTKRFAAPVVGSRETYQDYGRKGWERTRDVTAAAPFVGSTAIEYSDRHGKLWLRCPAGHAVEAKKILGRVTDHECGAKCLASKGPACECACGGANHGKSWS